MENSHGMWVVGFAGGTYRLGAEAWLNEVGRFGKFEDVVQGSHWVRELLNLRAEGGRPWRTPQTMR